MFDFLNRHSLPNYLYIGAVFSWGCFAIANHLQDRKLKQYRKLTKELIEYINGNKAPLEIHELERIYKLNEK